MFETLPHIVIKQILSYLESPFDKICFVFVSKNLYSNRERFLYFETSAIKTDHKGHHLNSFKNCIKQSFLDSPISWPSYTEINRDLDSLEHLKQSIATSSLKGILVEINLNYIQFKTPIPPNLLPKTLRKMYLGVYDHELEENTLPNGLTHLNLGHQYQHALKPGDLPSTLTHLTLSYKYDKPIQPNVLPAGLISFEMGNESDFELGKGVLPIGLRKLKLKSHFEQHHSLAIPSTVTKLNIGRISQPILSGQISPYITHLTIPKMTVPLHTDSIPMSVTCLRFMSYDMELQPGVIPESVETLYLSTDYQHPLGSGVLPSSLTYLNLGVAFNHITLVLPKKLHTLRLSSNFNQPLAVRQLPKSLRTLIFGVDFNQPLEPYHLNQGLTHLQFGINYDQLLLVGALPSSLETLILGPNFKQSIRPGLLPENLKRLEFGEKYHKTLTAGVIPSNVTHLVLGNCFGQTSLQEGIIPDSVTYLQVTSFQSSFLLSSPKRKIHVQLTRPNFIPMEIRMFDETHLLAIDKRMFGGFISISDIDRLRDYIFSYWSHHNIATLQSINLENK